MTITIRDYSVSLASVKALEQLGYRVIIKIVR